MKHIKNYKIILGITFIFIFINLYVVLYQGNIKLPNKNWSKEIAIESLKLPDQYRNIDNDDMELIKFNEYYYLIYFSENTLTLNQYDINLNLIDSTKIEKAVLTVDDLNVYLDNLNNLHINFLENTKLHTWSVNLDGKILRTTVDAYNVQKVKYFEENILYSKYNKIYLNNKKIIGIDKFIDLSFFEKDNAFYISYINHNPNTYTHELNTLKVQNNNIITSKSIKDFALKASTFVIDMDSTELDDSFALMVVIHDKKKNEFFNDNYEISYNLNILNESRKNSQGYQFSYTGKADSFIQKDNDFIDIRDISTTNEKFPNIIMTKNDEKIKLTNTKRFPNKAKYYSFDNGDHLLFSQLKRNEILDIYVSSTVDEHISKSQKLNIIDYIGLFFSTLITFFPLFIFGQVHSLLFLVPIFFIVVPFTFVKLNWAEWNPNKVLFFSIFLFLMSKTIYLVFFVNPSSLPAFLSDTGSRLLVAYLLSGVSIYSMIDRSGPVRNHFYADFFTFFIFDIVTFTLFFSPYLLL